jgi:hypothetical protein
MAQRVCHLFAALRTGLRRILTRDGPHWAHIAWTHNPMWLRPEAGDLPPGHPERLACDLPVSEVERGLWAQLRG